MRTKLACARIYVDCEDISSRFMTNITFYNVYFKWSFPCLNKLEGMPFQCTKHVSDHDVCLYLRISMP